MNDGKISERLLLELQKIRLNLSYGDNSNQEELNYIAKEWEKYKDFLRPNEKSENFNLVDKEGNFTQLYAPRWLCHLFGLRHMSVHVLLKWYSPRLGNVYIFQVRSWNKSDSPGHLDISVGGHVVGNDFPIAIQTAYREMDEELGISKTDLNNEELTYLMGYESSEERLRDHFYNVEWRMVYLGEINQNGIYKIRFNDKEVVGLYLCPESEGKNILNQRLIPIASALKLSLPKIILNFEKSLAGKI